MGIATGAQYHGRSDGYGVTGSYASFLTLREQDRCDVLEAAASRLNTLPGYVEKDFWVCLVYVEMWP